ncbi:DUF5752 family protein [Candidatus Pacearchaeota archaeon]|nr:DUF5752 family protein [Candidatus Pacearchaeota archaeon]
MVIKDPSSYFYVCDGTILKNLEDLFHLLKRIDNPSLEHHFNSEKNDFSNWTRDVLKEKALANKLDKAKTREEMILAIEKKLNTPSRVRKSVISQIKDAIANG